MLKRAAKFAKRAMSEIRYVKFINVAPFNGMWSGGMAEYSTTRNALLYETKVSQK